MAAPPPPPPPRGGGLSLYANLLEPAADASSATISSAPVRYDQSGDSKDASTARKPLDPSLRFQPIRRPQAKPARPSKPAFPRPAAAAAATTQTNASAPPPAAASATPAPPPGKTTLADWAATEEDEWRYGLGEKRQRGGRKKKKTKRHGDQLETDWDELYDPTKPTNVEEYLRSDERIREVQDWKAVLYRHRRRRASTEDSEEDTRPFAPPPNYAFAPPPVSPPPPPRSPTPPPPPPAGEPATSAATISRAPVRYTQPQQQAADNNDPPPADAPSEDTSSDEPRSLRPGQAGFAQRLMSKYGWTRGSGLGVDESGILDPLRVQVEKRRRKADADGGGWADPANKARIIGGTRKDGEASRFGAMSDVVVLRNMLEGMPDLAHEVESGLGQEIGEECGEKYGRVERLYIDVENRQVFIRFTNSVSALRAVNELDGRIFNGNTVAAAFYDTDRDGMALVHYAEVLAPYIGYLLRASITMGLHLDHSKQAVTVVIPKRYNQESLP
ncbi:G-patch domain-containing protein [Plectosphaerella plurivora]|uniref:G-patch domain-containing protein n=1 Tax=Plectosphaerella plurivora TaxID=936078 RepID=A0A9P8VP06_9PEZI|nr:G-patch domain-containing protein [Plectosphaerella plurivora]